jgi:hypothetical protein
VAENEIAEIQERVNAALIAMIQAAGQMAQVLIEARVAQLQRAARVSEDRARQVRGQMRAAHQADAVVWRAASRPSWWRQASAEDISRVWRAASAWSQVDPRAEAALRTVVERLAERGIHINLAEGDRPDSAAWLSDALDRAAVLDDTGDLEPTGGTRELEAGGGGGSRGAAPGQGSPAAPTSSGRPSAAQAAAARQAQMAEHVRAVWSPERADRVLRSEAWPALAHKLDQLKQQGHDVEALLRQVPRFVDQAHTPAAFAFRVVDDVASERTVDGQWKETSGVPSVTAPVPAADVAQGQAAGSDSPGAARVAATGYPTSTKSAVAAAHTAGAQDSTSPAVTVAASARPRPATELAGR